MLRRREKKERGEKNEISIDDYLLNNTLLSFLSRSFATARVRVPCRCRRWRTRLSNFAVRSSSR